MLVILDGWGWREEREGNAILLAKTPVWDVLWKSYPHTFLKTSGESVGLPHGTIGNSEVGHLNIGAGRIVLQDLERINRSIKDRSFFQNDVLLTCCREAADRHASLHLIGLCSDVGVHAHLDHLDALLDLAKESGVKCVLIHAITDGRDSAPTLGKRYLERVEKKVAHVGNARVATVSGRYYAMDRDKRWDRTERAWRAIVLGEGKEANSSVEVIARSYAAKVTDEFILPTVITKGEEYRGMDDGDAVIFFNFRADRARQLTRAMTLDDFDSFDRPRKPKLSSFVCMTEFDETFDLPVAFTQKHLENIFGKVIADQKLKQLRIAETEKYAHVTFFLNGGEETPFPGEERILIPSPRDVPTYDLKPEMSADKVTEEVLARINSDAYDVIILNFANPDMVGHTGRLDAAVKAVEKVDACLEKIVDAVLKRGGALVITADHGNCEKMFDESGGPHTAHTMNPVPLLYVAKSDAGIKLRHGGMLCDLAPTLLHLLRIAQPPEMTGKTLL